MRRLVFVIIAIVAGVAAAQEFELKDGDRVLFYGDSITEAGAYTRFIENYVLTRFPKLRVAFHNAGVGGDRVIGGAAGPITQRIPRDIVAYRPTVLTICLGMNDGHYTPFRQEILDAYLTGLEHIVVTVKKTLPKARIWIVGPPAYDDVTRTDTGYNASLVRLNEGAKALATRFGLGFADTNTPMVTALKSVFVADSQVHFIPDRVHPDIAGHLIMAYAILKAWRAPSVVNSLSIAADTLECSKLQIEVRGAHRSETGVMFETRSAVLPMPLDPSIANVRLVLAALPIESTLNLQLLSVTGLRAGAYALRVDGKQLDVFNSEELQKGINLATNTASPSSTKAMEIAQSTQERAAASYAFWRRVYVPLWQSDRPAADKLRAQMNSALDSWLARQRRAVTTQPWLKWEVVRQ